jgi:hypothetical protein
MANIIGLFRRLRHRRPALCALTLAPQAIQGLERRSSIRLLVRQKTADDEAGASDTGPAMHVDAAAALERLLDIGEHLAGLRDVVGHAGIGDGRAQIIRAAGQQMPVSRHLALFRKIDERIDARFVQPRETNARFRPIGAGWMFASQHTTGYYPVGIGQRPIHDIADVTSDFNSPIAALAARILQMVL